LDRSDDRAGGALKAWARAKRGGTAQHHPILSNVLLSAERERMTFSATNSTSRNI